MATEKEKLQARAEELGLESEGTVAQLKANIAAVEAEEGAEPAEPTPEVVDETPTVAPTAPAAPDAIGALPEAPVNPTVQKPKAVPSGMVRTYDVKSSFWLMTNQGMALAQNGGTVKLTEKQAAKYLRHGNIKLAS